MSQSVRILIGSGKAHVSWRNGSETWDRTLSRAELDCEIEELSPGSLRDTLINARRQLLSGATTLEHPYSTLALPL